VPDPLSYPGTPRWVKVSGIILAALVLAAVVVILTGSGGPHGPGRHMPMDAGDTAPTSAIDELSGGDAGQQEDR
jgi:hypothetical protein